MMAKMTRAQIKALKERIIAHFDTMSGTLVGTTKKNHEWMKELLVDFQGSQRYWSDRKKEGAGDAAQKITDHLDKVGPFAVDVHNNYESDAKNLVRQEVEEIRDALIKLLATDSIKEYQKAFDQYAAEFCGFFKALKEYGKAPKEFKDIIDEDWPAVRSALHDYIFDEVTSRRLPEKILPLNETGPLNQIDDPLDKIERLYTLVRENILKNYLTPLLAILNSLIQTYFKRMHSETELDPEQNTGSYDQVLKSQFPGRDVNREIRGAETGFKDIVIELNKIDTIEKLIPNISLIHQWLSGLLQHMKNILELLGGQLPMLKEASVGSIKFSSLDKIETEAKDLYRDFMTIWNRIFGDIQKRFTAQRLSGMTLSYPMVQQLDDARTKLPALAAKFHALEAEFETEIQKMELFLDPKLYASGTGRSNPLILIRQINENLQNMRDALIAPQRYCHREGINRVLAVGEVLRSRHPELTNDVKKEIRDTMEAFLRTEREKWENELWKKNYLQLKKNRLELVKNQIRGRMSGSS